MTLHGCGSCTARLRVLFAMALLSLSAGRSDAREPMLPRPAGYQVIDSTSGALLLYRRIPLGNDSAAAYLQVVDLHRCAVRQLCVETSNQGLNEGKYYPPENNSPYFRRFLYTALDSILSTKYAGRSASGLFSITNGQFFEQYDDSSQLSFPIKVRGKVLTGGNSPYGPTPLPRHPYYLTAQLRALLLFGDSAAITAYNPQSGSPLNRTKVREAIVSYSYKDHPAKVLGKNPRNRYLLLALAAPRGRPGRQYLMILSIVGATLDEGAVVLQEAGARGDILTLDGGTSIFLRTRSGGVILRPQAGSSGAASEPRALPHYLLIFKK